MPGLQLNTARSDIPSDIGTVVLESLQPTDLEIERRKLRQIVREIGSGKGINENVVHYAPDRFTAGMVVHPRIVAAVKGPVIEPARRKDAEFLALVAHEHAVPVQHQFHVAVAAGVLPHQTVEIAVVIGDIVAEECIGISPYEIPPGETPEINTEPVILIFVIDYHLARHIGIPPHVVQEIHTHHEGIPPPPAEPYLGRKSRREVRYGSIVFHVGILLVIELEIEIDIPQKPLGGSRRRT